MAFKAQIFQLVPLAVFLLISLLFYFGNPHLPPSFQAPSFDYLKNTLLGNSTSTLDYLKHTLLGNSTRTSIAPDPKHPHDSTVKLSQLCSSTKWRPGLWLHCHSYCGVNGTSICGGLNNARNRVQTCIRLAIDAGAGLIIPSATARNEKDLLNTNDETLCAEVFWNMEFLQESLKKSCPQLGLRMCDDRTGIDRIIESPRREYMNPAFLKGAFREYIDMVLESQHENLRNLSVANSAIFNYGDSYIGWNYRASDELDTIRKALFKSLTFNKDLLDLSTQICHDEKLKHGSYIGVHLRGESDWPASFGSVEDQMRLYIREIESIQALSPNGIKTIYVSCGDQSAIQRFRDQLSPLNYTVLDKNLILASRPAALNRLEALPFDRKAIVEYQVLVDAKFFMGVIMSSMSSLIAYARTVDDAENYFETYVFSGSQKIGLERKYSTWHVEPIRMGPRRRTPDQPGLNLHLGILEEELQLQAPQIAMEVPRIVGNNNTRLMVVDGVDIMDSFP